MHVGIKAKLCVADTFDLDVITELAEQLETKAVADAEPKAQGDDAITPPRGTTTR